jgi:hypothetical protein
MSIQIQLTLKDYLRAYRAHMGWNYFSFPILGSVFIIAGVCELSLFGRSVASGLAAIGFGVFCLVALPIGLRRNFKANKKISIPFSVTASGEGIELTSEHGNSFTRWQAYIQFAETDDVLLLYPQRLLYNVYPKRFFAPEQLEEFSRLVHANVAPKKGEGRRFILIVAVWVFILLAIVVSYEIMTRS